MKKVLHVGCGPNTIQSLKGFRKGGWEEVRLDINPDVNPDIVGTITDMSGVPDSSVDAVFSAHNIEHVYANQALPALKEFRRVLKADGFLVVTCPDLEATCAALVEFGPTTPLYQSTMGPVTALDILYGHIDSIAQGNEYMAHKGGFTRDLLASTLEQAGFKDLIGGAPPQSYDLWFLAFASELSLQEKQEAAVKYLP